MSFFLLMVAVAVIGWLISFVLRRPMNLRDAMRTGAIGAFLFTGVDHFISTDIRYLPMLPVFFGSLARPLVLLTGAAEIAGAIGLLVPQSAFLRLGLPNLRYAAGVALAVMLAFLVIANINVALKGGGVNGLAFGPWYFWLRPVFQPIIILWVLYAAGVIGCSASCTSKPTGAASMPLRQLLRWQWNGYRQTHLSRANIIIHVITTPVFLLGTIAVVCAIVSLSLWLGIGGMFAMASALALQGLGHQLEPNAPAPFTSVGNAVSRILLEQWVTFPRYLLSRSWRQQDRSCQ